MIYFPKSQIKTNLFSIEGQFIYKETEQPYLGPYWAASTGQYFSGKTPNDNNVEELILPTPKTKTNNPQFNSVTANYIKGYKNLPTNKEMPLNFIISPTKEDRESGEFIRYFVKQINQDSYLELDKKTYDRIINRDPTIYWSLYIPIYLMWQLEGEREKVYKTNRDIVRFTEQKFKITNLGNFLKSEYTKFLVT